MARGGGARRILLPALLALLATLLAPACARSAPLDGGAAAFSAARTIITAHVIPHTHCDPGWLETEEVYYRKYVQMILRGVLEALEDDPTGARRFAWAETSFLVGDLPVVRVLVGPLREARCDLRRKLARVVHVVTLQQRLGLRRDLPRLA